MSPQEPISREHKTLLMLESDLQFARSVRQILEHPARRLIHTRSVPDACGILDREDVDLVICELVLREEDGTPCEVGGLSLINHLLLRTGTCPPIIALSNGNSDTGILRHARQLGVASAIQRPVDVEELVCEVDQILDRSFDRRSDS